MKYRKGVFVVTYSKKGNEKKYLILKRKHHWTGWEFPKGGINFLEGQKHAVKREIKEESGLKILNIKNLKVHGKYKYRKQFEDRPGIIGQTFTLFAVEVKAGKPRIDKIEHDGYKWMSFNEAMKKLTWQNQKKCLKVADWELKNEN
jgi:bis(5'-nucleosidyl)-tetraphosphatase